MQFKTLDLKSDKTNDYQHWVMTLNFRTLTACAKIMQSVIAIVEDLQ